MRRPVSARLRGLVVQRANSLCEYCLIHQDDAHLSFQVDHIISRKQRGPTISANLALACLRCNVAKSTDPGAFIGQPRRLVRLYHPREDHWGEHFRLAAARILPRTDVGEASVQLLNLNAGDRLLLRRTLIKAGRYPSMKAIALLRD